jgi:hypothetical protein
LVFCTTPTFEHLPPIDAAEDGNAEIVTQDARQIANAPTIFLFFNTLKTYI